MGGQRHTRKSRSADRQVPAGMKKVSLPVALFLTLLLGLVVLFFLAFEGKPLVVETDVPTVETAQRAKQLARSVLDALNSQGEAAGFAASEEDLNALMTLVGRGERRIAGRFVVTPGIVILRMSVRLPAGRYLNLRGELLPDERGLDVNLVRIGKIGFHRPLAKALLVWGLNLGLGGREGAALLGSVKSVSVSGRTVTVELRSAAQTKERLKRLQGQLSRLRDIGRGGEPPWDAKVVGIYYGRLLETGSILGAAPSLALTDFLGPLFRLAAERSRGGDPVRENSSALLALSLFLGNPLFDKLTGLRMNPELLGRSYYGRPVLLDGRNDSRLHFVISAGLKLLSDQGISSAVGEFKELLDAGRGGSGFSFVDLASDRAGVRFAEVASDPAGGARRLQALLAEHPAEMRFYPVVAGLPENIPQAEFERIYGGVDDPRYAGMVREIDRRIGFCPAYSGGAVGDR